MGGQLPEWVQGDSPGSPGYPTYSQFINLLEKLGAEPLPEQLKLGNLGIAQPAASRLTGALKYLGLINSGLKPTLELQGLLRKSPAQRRHNLGELFRSRYSWIWDLPRGTSFDRFCEELRARCDLTGATLLLAGSFVTTAARDLGLDLPVDPPKRGRRPRSAKGRRIGEAGSERVPGLAGERREYRQHLMSISKANLAAGKVDPDILDRLERCLAVE